MVSATDFLTKELFIKRNVVTFRSLSRELGIHVNEAKNELATFYATTNASSSLSFPTYLISGDVSASNCKKNAVQDGTQDDGMDVDSQENVIHMDIVSHTKLALVTADALEETKMQFSHISSIHVYSLSPSVIDDAGLVCVPSAVVREKDVRQGSALADVVGKIVGTVGTGTPVTTAMSNLKMKSSDAPEAAEPLKKPSTSVKSDSKVKEEAPAVEKPPREATRPTEKSKATGKLDWSKAKSKEVAPLKSKPSGSLSKNETDEFIKVDEDKRILVQGTKRNSKGKSLVPPPLSESEEEGYVKPPSRQVRSRQNALRVKQGKIMSDDEDEDANVSQPATKVKKAAADSDSERSLRAMMDIDDEHVIKASKATSSSHAIPDDEEGQEEDVDIATDNSEAIPKPKKRKVKKTIPVGRNGLKKKKVMKTRTTTDAKGYMITEDYSSYESVNENEPEPEPTKGKRKRNPNDTPPEPKSKPETSRQASRASKTKSAPAKRGNLLHFFGPEGSKK